MTLAGAPILTAAQMRDAEDRAIAAGTSAETLMDRAAWAIAELARRMAAGRPVLVLAGPGNNGGDGYAAARLLREHGINVRVAAVGAPQSDLCRLMADRFDEAVAAFNEAEPAPLLIDAIYGTGARGGLPEELARFWTEADRVLAVDVPSVLDADRPGDVGDFPADVTLALGALKPVHVLEPGAEACGQVRLDTLDIPATGDVTMSVRPRLSPPGPGDHKYTRGLVGVVAGAMPGAAALAAEAAARSGAGYVKLAGEAAAILPHAVVRVPDIAALLADKRPDALLIGPGLVDGAEAVSAVMQGGLRTVFDGGALPYLKAVRLPTPAILTPHEGEFTRLFGAGEGNKIDRTRAAAQVINAVIIHKGADTVIAAPDGRVRVAPRGSAWLSTAGSGDVLAGLCVGFLARMPANPLAAAEAAIWLHQEAARRVGPGFIADDLARAVSPALSAFL